MFGEETPATTAAVARDLDRFRNSAAARSLETGGWAWRYRVLGEEDRPNIVMLPGGLRVSEPYFEVALRLAEDFRVVTLDYPPEYTISGLCEGVSAVLDREAPAGPVVLLGQSFGGLLAQFVARREAGRVGALVIGNTGQLRRPSPSARLGAPAFAVVARLLPAPLATRMAERSFFRLLRFPEEERDFWTGYWTELFSSGTVSKEDFVAHLVCVSDALARPSEAVGRDWARPVLLLGSDDDPAISASQRGEMRRVFPSAEEFVFEGAGHTPYLSKRQEYAGRVARFAKAAL